MSYAQVRCRGCESHYRQLRSRGIPLYWRREKTFIFTKNTPGAFSGGIGLLILRVKASPLRAEGCKQPSRWLVKCAARTRLMRWKGYPLIPGEPHTSSERLRRPSFAAADVFALMPRRHPLFPRGKRGKKHA